MVVFPNCKINLGLHILNKREDGYHNLETVFYPINITDAVEIIVSKKTDNPITFSSSGLHINGNAEDNICVKAYHLLKKDFKQMPAIKMHLHKSIPMGAGLGGGSADGAFVLQLLNKKFNLNLSTTSLLNYTAQLGSDCPFFILNQPCYATRRGEILEPLHLNLSDYKIALVHPSIAINTAWAFSQWANFYKQPNNILPSIKNIICQPINFWKQSLKNDFEEIIFKKYPAIKNVKTYLYNQGAIYASMSGSGSTVFGIFEKEKPVFLNALPYPINLINL